MDAISEETIIKMLNEKPTPIQNKLIERIMLDIDNNPIPQPPNAPKVSATKLEKHKKAKFYSALADEVGSHQLQP